MGDCLPLPGGIGQAVLDALPDAVVVINSAGAIVAVNTAWNKHAQLNGFTADEHCVGADYFATCGRITECEVTGGGSLVDAIQAVLRGESQSLALEYVYTLPAGRRWCRLTASPSSIYSEPAAVLIHVDVTEHKAAEQARRTSEQRFEALIEQAPIAVCISRGGAVLYANPELIKMLGYASAESFVGRPVIDVFSTRYQEASLERTRRRLLGMPVPREFDACLIRADGSEFPVHLAVGPVQLTDGPANVSFLWDTTEQQKAEDNLALLASIVHSCMDPIVATSIDGEVETWNPAAERLFGFSESEIVGKSIELILPADRRHEVVEILARARQDQPTERFQTVRQDSSGHLIDVLLSVSPVKTASGEIVGTAANLHDIRELKQTQRQLSRQIDRLSALRAIDLAIISGSDIKVAANEILSWILTTSNVDAASLLIYDPDRDMLKFAAGVGFKSAKIRSTSLRTGEGIAGRVALTREAVVIPSLKNDSSFARRDLVEAEHFEGYAAIPLVAKGHVMGVVEVYHRSILSLPDDEWEFLRSLAQQAAIAIDNARLFDGLERSNTDLRLAYDATIEGWARLLDLRDKETEGHSRRVAELTLDLAEAVGISGESLIHIRRGALLHDIGKMAIPDSILMKTGPLTSEERTIMEEHPTFAYQMLSPIEFLRPSLDIPYCHHERWDGAGYPRCLKGEQIPLAARIFTVIDVWDALRSRRPYRHGWSAERVLNHIKRHSGSHFDPRIVDTFSRLDPVQFPDYE